jgi:hypothetical protein
MRRSFVEVTVRTLIASATVALVFVIPNAGSPQTVQLRAGAPLVYQGETYYPSGPTVFFDGAIMVRVGTYEGMPIYVNPFTDPTRYVLVPIGGKLMRPYERRPSEVAAGLVYPPAPEFPDQPFQEPENVNPPETTLYPVVPPSSQPCAALPACGVAPSRGPAGRGIWIEFRGRMWTPTRQEPDRSPRLKVIGYYFDFPVFQDPARPDRIFVPATEGGPLIQYDLRPK